MEKLSSWASSACAHILEARIAKTEKPCMTFEGEHAKDFMAVRAQQDVPGPDTAEHLCAMVEKMLIKVSDEELNHAIPMKMTAAQYCTMRYGLESNHNDFFAHLKHYYVTGKHHHEEL